MDEKKTAEAVKFAIFGAVNAAREKGASEELLQAFRKAFKMALFAMELEAEEHQDFDHSDALGRFSQHFAEAL